MKKPSEMTDRELDEAVAVEVMGYAWHQDEFGDGMYRFLAAPTSNIGKAPPWDGSPMPTLEMNRHPYSTSIADAMKVVEKIIADGEFPTLGYRTGNTRTEVNADDHVGWYAWFRMSDVEACNPSLSRAICEAAILAVRASAPANGNQPK